MKATVKKQVFGLTWWERRGRKPLWRKEIAGKAYTHSGDGSGQPSEGSAEIALKAITEKARQAVAVSVPADLSGVEIHIEPAHPRLPRPVIDWPAEVQAYVTYQEQRQAAGEITLHALASIRAEVGHFVWWLGRYGEEISEPALLRYRQHLVTRMQQSKGKASTLQRRLSACKRVVRWLWEQRILGDMPRNLSALTFKQPKGQKHGQIDVYSVDELRRIWAECCEETRLHMLLGLQCGFYYADIADLKHSEITASHIVRDRHKTGVSGQWLLWGETRRLLAAHVQPDQPTALRHTDGSPLYDYSSSKGKLKRVNHIESRFKDALQRAGVNGHFRKLRATGATLVKQASDSDTARLFLAHAPATMAEQHYIAKDFSRLDAALQEVEKLLDLH